MDFSGNHLLNFFSYNEVIHLYKMDDFMEKAKTVVFEIFKDKVDKSGRAYIEHLIRVSNKLQHPKEKVAGLLHDTFEDTSITYKDLLDIGFPKDILDIVQIVTKEKVTKYPISLEEKLHIYYKKIDSIINSGNIHAIRLKEADMSDNYDSNRLKKLPKEKQIWFHKKYGTQIEKLRKRIENEKEGCI